MKNFFKTKTSIKCKIIINIFILLVIFAFILFNFFHDRNNDFIHYQQSMGILATHKVANEVNNILAYKKKLLEAFLEDHEPLLEDIANNIDDDELYEELNEKLKRYFYDYFTSSLASDKGYLLRFSFGDIGRVCISDMKTYIETDVPKIRIHPNVTMYHYDILVPLALKGKKYLFICSFTSDEIASLLDTSAPINHNLLIVDKTQDFLIEITKKGSRDTSDLHGNLNLSEKEQKHILASKNIVGTYWHVVDSYNQSFFDKNKQMLIKDYLMMFFSFAIVLILMGWYILHNIKKINNTD